MKFVSESVDGDYAVVRGAVSRKTGPEVAAEVRLIRKSSRFPVW